jgi:hypothetical protein
VKALVSMGRANDHEGITVLIAASDRFNLYRKTHGTAARLFGAEGYTIDNVESYPEGIELSAWRVEIGHGDPQEGFVAEYTGYFSDTVVMEAADELLNDILRGETFFSLRLENVEGIYPHRSLLA